MLIKWNSPISLLSATRKFNKVRSRSYMYIYHMLYVAQLTWDSTDIGFPWSTAISRVYSWYLWHLHSSSGES